MLEEEKKEEAKEEEKEEVPGAEKPAGRDE